MATTTFSGPIKAGTIKATTVQLLALMLKTQDKW